MFKYRNIDTGQIVEISKQSAKLYGVAQMRSVEEQKLGSYARETEVEMVRNSLFNKQVVNQDYLTKAWLEVSREKEAVSEIWSLIPNDIIFFFETFGLKNDRGEPIWKRVNN